MDVIDSTPEFVSNAYQKMERKLEIVRARLNRPLTLAERCYCPIWMTRQSVS